MICKKNIFDAHMHLGKAYKEAKEGTLNEYIKFAQQIGISEAVVMPPCVPDFQLLPSGEKYMPFFWKDGKAVRVLASENGIKYENIASDPFVDINRKFFYFIKKTEKNCKIKLYFAPLMHPLFGTFSTFSEKEWKDIIAIKIHPAFFKIGVSDIHPDFFNIIEKMKKPLIIHTGKTNSLAYEWLKLLQNYDIKVLFTHACRLDPISAEIINSDDRYYIGIAPYKRLDNMQQFIKCESFLDGVLSLFKIKKIVFDTDYPENIDEAGNIYFDFLKDFQKLGLSNYELSKICFENAQLLFND